jgi:hypothetical protein
LTNPQICTDTSYKYCLVSLTPKNNIKYITRTPNAQAEATLPPKPFGSDEKFPILSSQVHPYFVIEKAWAHLEQHLDIVQGMLGTYALLGSIRSLWGELTAFPFSTDHTLAAPGLNGVAFNMMQQASPIAMNIPHAEARF